MTATVADFITKANQRCLQTQAIEDAFGRCKNLPRYMNRRGCVQSAFGYMVDTKILSVVHDYLEPQAAEQSRKAARNSTFEQGVFEPKLQQTSVKFQEISGKSASPAWYSPGSDNRCVAFLDLYLLKQCFQQGADSLLDEAWLSELVHLRHKLLLKYGGRWYFALQNHGDTAALVWPAEGFVFHMVPRCRTCCVVGRAHDGMVSFVTLKHVFTRHIFKTHAVVSCCPSCA